ncbi:MAG: N-acetylglucosamine-6-phosphate deacetylase [Streptosporangiales bacterium]|nr:N-acetylglucosamine-6-phosphate deacetylase [Streptosporangiales bacterium]MBO0891158.1 N-acetylglucosamine-6-phosphate deacetylase [Acidothermales bacterium]
MTVLGGGQVVLPDRVVDGWVQVVDGRVREVGTGPEPEDRDRRDVEGGYVLPGFVDIHCHGGGGASFSTTDRDEACRAARFHLAHGTTTMLASLVTASSDTLAAQAGTLGRLAVAGVVAGVHFEGPFLSAKRCGAQDPAYLRDPDPAGFDRLVAAADGHARMMTVAPELPGAVDLVRWIVDAGVVAAVGHTDATYEQTRQAVDAGARVATHLFNGMRPLHHREPGPVLACLAAAEVTCELINDGTHLADPVVAYAASSEHVALVTDAMAAAGMPDGVYRLGTMRVRVVDGVARLAEGDTIAGSTLTMDVAVRRAILDVGLTWPLVARAAALTPARVLGLDHLVGSLEPGKRADLVVLDPADLAVRAVMRAGEWVSTSPAR